MRLKILIISLFILTFRTLTAQDPVAYIRQYEDIAVSEMQRSGIPASIKLAQAILESNCGKSELACKANNHFGIKCGGNWDGKTYHREDDDYQNGQLIKSCFREFDSVLDSYMAHSDFLTDPAKVTRYGSLFKLDITDYKGWASGLSKAGYATDPQYAKRLIDIIEKYELYRFDNEYQNDFVAGSPPASSGYQLVKYNNDVKYTLALKGDNANLLAARQGISVNQLMRFNENIQSRDKELKAGTIVYLEAKRSKYHGKEKYHILKEGEDMYTVSQKYGVKLDALLRRNGLEIQDVPLPKQKIMLKGKAKKELRTVTPYETPGQKKNNPAAPGPAPAARTQPAEHGEITTSASTKPATTAKPTPETLAVTHVVSKGDTLYGIARTYGISVDDLKRKNNLSVDTIYVGQKLVWK